MENRYRKLTENIHTPAGLNERVLFEARRRTAESESSRRERRSWPLLRTAVCAVCALALVLGGFTLRPAPAAPPGASGPAGNAAPGTEQGTPAQVLVPTFGLTAYAAGTDTTYGPASDGSIAFSVGEGCTTPEFGDFTGCLFQIAGENIAQVRLSIDRGGLYRYEVRENLTEEQMDGYRQAMAEGSLVPAPSASGTTGSGICRK